MQHEALSHVAYTTSVAMGAGTLDSLVLPVGMNIVTGLAYIAISVAILVLRQKRPDMTEHRLLYIVFASFIFWCAMHHLTHAASYIWPLASAQYFVDTISALVSLVAAVVVWRTLPLVTEIPHPRDFALTHERLALRERELAERKELEQWRDEFLSATSHELKNPLAAQRLSLELMRMYASSERYDRCLELIDDLEHHSMHLERITDDLADITRTRSKQMHYNFAETDLNAVALRVVRHIQRERTEPVLELSGTSPRVVRADELRVEQVLHNLLSNALKYAPKSERITIAIEHEGTHVRVSVTDQGPGVSEGERARLFERFYRGARSQKSVPGLGIGLFLCKVIVEDHGGEIEARNGPEGGATFAFTLPYV